MKWNYTTIYAKNKQEQEHTHENCVCKRKQTRQQQKEIIGAEWKTILCCC